MVKQAIEAGIVSITSTNRLLKQFQLQFMPRLQLMAGRVGAAHHLVRSIREQVEAQVGADEHEGILPSGRSGDMIARGMQQAWRHVAPVPERDAVAGHHSAAADLSNSPVADAADVVPGEAAHCVVHRLFEHRAGQHGISASSSISIATGRPLAADPAGAASASQLVQPPSLDALMADARQQKQAAMAVLATSSPAANSSSLETPTWAAGLDPEPLRQHLGGALAKAEQHRSLDGFAASLQPSAAERDSGEQTYAADPPVEAELRSLHDSLAEASHEQHALLASLQLELQGVSDRLSASALELDMLRAETESAREQVSYLMQTGDTDSLIERLLAGGANVCLSWLRCTLSIYMPARGPGRT
jgi:hypothetical protein